MAAGFTFGATFGFSKGYSFGIAIDSMGNIHLQESKFYGGGMPNASVGGYKSYINAPNMNDIESNVGQIGGSVSVYGPLAVGGDVIMSGSKNDDNSGYIGYSGCATIGLRAIPAEGHGGVTEPIFDKPIFFSNDRKNKNGK